MDNNLETKNEYFLKKQEKDEIAKGEKKKNAGKKLTKWLIFAVITALFIWWVYDYFKTASTKQVQLPGEYFQAQSRDHIQSGATHAAYNSNPPTGGWHYDQPAQTGIYDTEFKDEQMVHNLEHGHIWVAYKPDLSADQIEKLANIAKGYGSKIIMAPRSANDTPIAIVAWEHLFKLSSVDEGQIKAFIDGYRGIAGPEMIPDFGFKDFRTKK